MTRHAFRSVAAALALSPCLATAQVHAEFRVDLPVVLPPMVVVSPGVQVVQDVNEEVFFHDGYYWCRRDGRWWRSRHHREGWVMVEPRRVPPGLARIPPGQYRKWHAPPGYRPAGYKEARHERKEWRKEEKRERKEERKELRREEKGERGHGHGRGHGG